MTEQFPAPDQLCVTGPDGRFVHEIVVPMRCPAKTTTSDPARRQWTQGRRPTLTPGDGWLTASVFGSEATLDRLLAARIGPLVRQMRAAGTIDGWFFLRYWNPRPHLRIRLRGTRDQIFGDAWPQLQAALQPFIDTGEIHALQLDSYSPEMSRYGGPAAIAAAERVFEADSTMALELMALHDPGLPDMRERLALIAVDSLLRAFGLGAADREGFAGEMASLLAADMSVGTDAGIALGQRFRALKSELSGLIAGDADNAWLPAARQAIAGRTLAVSQYRTLCEQLDRASELTAPVSDILGSIVHMSVNRMIPGAPRAVELVIYDLLRRLYRAERARGCAE